MKKRTEKRIRKTGTAVLAAVFAVCSWGICGQSVRAGEIYAERPQIYLTQTARWTKKAEYRAEITMELHGLNAYRQWCEQEQDNFPAGSALQGELLLGEDTEEIYADDVYAEDAYTEENDTEKIETEENSTEEDRTEENNTEENRTEENETDDVYTEEIYTEDGGTEEVNIEETIEENGDIYEDCETSKSSVPAEMDSGESSGIYLETELEPVEEEVPPVPIQRELVLVNYISEYFQPDMERIPREIQTEPLLIRNQNGGETAVTKTVCPVDCTLFAEDDLSVTIPVILREEYRISGHKQQLAVSQDEPLEKDCPGTGAFAAEKSGDESEILASAVSPVLELEAATADFTMEMTSDGADLKAGQSFTYELNVKNTGERTLSDMIIESSFCKENIKAVWEPGEGVQVNGRNAMINRLAKGETAVLRMTVKLTEDQDGILTHTVKAKTSLADGEILERTALEKVEIAGLKADFTVEKTADRTEVFPGEKVTYQICIRNTGERTLHSVVGTERFRDAGVQARFVPQSGVTLNADRTQALISRLDPGQACALLAEVTIPPYMEKRELVNQVVVKAQETGERTVESESTIAVNGYEITPTPYMGAQSWYQSGGGKSAGYESWQASSKPQTGDNTEIGLLAALLVLAAGSGAGALWQRHTRNQAKKRK